MVPPSGDPATLLKLASQLEMAASGAHSLGGSTADTVTLVREAAQWTGSGATAASDLASDLGSKMTGTSEPLLQIASAVRTYADDLQNAQQAVDAYNLSVADQVMAAGSPGYEQEMQTLGDAATNAVTTWQQSATKAASTITEAADELGGTFKLPPDDGITLAGTGTGTGTGIFQPTDDVPGQDIVDMPGIGPTLSVNLPGDVVTSLKNFASTDDGEDDGTTPDDPGAEGGYVGPATPEDIEEWEKDNPVIPGEGIQLQPGTQTSVDESGRLIVQAPPNVDGKSLVIVSQRMPDGSNDTSGSYWVKSPPS
jgi:uncharacterized protein YukE